MPPPTKRRLAGIENYIFDRNNQRNFVSVGCQIKIEKRDIGIQVTDNNTKFSSKIQPIISIQLLSLLCDLFKNSFSNWNSIHERVFSTIIYSVLRNFNVKYYLMGI